MSSLTAPTSSSATSPASAPALHPSTQLQQANQLQHRRFLLSLQLPHFHSLLQCASELARLSPPHAFLLALTDATQQPPPQQEIALDSMIALIRRSMEQIDRDLQATSAAVAELQTTASGVAETREAQRVASDVHTSPLRAMWKGYAEHGSQEQKLASIERAWRAERSRREVARLSRLLGDALRQLSTYSRRSAALWELRAVLQSRWSRAEELKGASAEDLENLRVELMEFCRVVEGVEQKLEEAILMLVVLRGQT